MIGCRSCVAILDRTVAEITLNGENKFFVLLFTTLNINRFCTENSSWKTYYIYYVINIYIMYAGDL